MIFRNMVVSAANSGQTRTSDADAEPNQDLGTIEARANENEDPVKDPASSPLRSNSIRRSKKLERK